MQIASEELFPIRALSQLSPLILIKFLWKKYDSSVVTGHWSGLSVLSGVAERPVTWPGSPCGTASAANRGCGSPHHRPRHSLHWSGFSRRLELYSPFCSSWALASSGAAFLQGQNYIRLVEAAEPWPTAEQPFSEVRIRFTSLQQLWLSLQWSSLSRRSELDSSCWSKWALASSGVAFLQGQN